MPGQHAGPEVLEQHVGAARPARRRSPGRRASLRSSSTDFLPAFWARNDAPMPGPVERRVRAEVAGQVAVARHLDLDDLGAEQHQLVAAVRAGQDVGQVEDPDAAQRSVVHACTPSVGGRGRRRSVSRPSGWSKPSLGHAARPRCLSAVDELGDPVVGEAQGRAAEAQRRDDRRRTGRVTGTATADSPSSRSPWLTAKPSTAASSIHSRSASTCASPVRASCAAIRASSGRAGVAQQDLRRGAGPQRQLVADVDDVPQRLRALLLGDADAVDVAGHVEVDRLALARGEVAHQLLGLRRQLPAALGQVRPAPQARPGHVAAGWSPTADRSAPGSAPGGSRSSWPGRSRRRSRGSSPTAASSVSSDRMSSARWTLRTPPASPMRVVGPDARPPCHGAVASSRPRDAMVISRPPVPAVTSP